MFWEMCFCRTVGVVFVVICILKDGEHGKYRITVLEARPLSLKPATRTRYVKSGQPNDEPVVDPYQGFWSWLFGC